MSHSIRHGRRRLLDLAAGFMFAVCSMAVAQEPPKKAVTAPPSASQAAATDRPVRGPLDPLTAAERRRAEGIAAGSARVRDLAGPGRVRLVYVELASEKPAGEPTVAGESRAGRFAEVLQYRFDNDSGIRTLVDLQRNEVRDVERVDGSAVPLTRADLDEAVKLALDANEVRELLGREARQYVAPLPSATKNPPYAIRALLVHSFADNDPCYRHRCVHLFFQRSNAYLIDSAIVDLTDRRVRIERGTR